METLNNELAEDTQQKDILPKLDYSITDPQERNKLVHQIVNSTPPEKLTPYYLEELTKYLVIQPTNKKEKNILTDNRMVTVNKRETSFQGLIAKLQSGEDGIYNFMTGGDKNVLLVPKIEITEEDIETVPDLKELREQIKKTQERQKKAFGKAKYVLTKQLIELRQQQYALKCAYKPPTTALKLTKNLNLTQVDLSQTITIDENGEPVSNGAISLFNPNHVSLLLCSYSKLKEDADGHFEKDLYYLMQDLDTVSEKALKKQHPLLYSIMVDKIDGLSNKEIAANLQANFNTTYSIEYISALWRKKIPKLISEQAKEDWIIWHYTEEEKGKWKRCSKCHEVKLAHPYFFTKNKTSKDGYYSLCKKCRNSKK